jgi:hypothetical protein
MPHNYYLVTVCGFQGIQPAGKFNQQPTTRPRLITGEFHKAPCVLKKNPWKPQRMQNNAARLWRILSLLKNFQASLQSQILRKFSEENYFYSENKICLRINVLFYGHEARSELFFIFY